MLAPVAVSHAIGTCPFHGPRRVAVAVLPPIVRVSFGNRIVRDPFVAHGIELPPAVLADPQRSHDSLIPSRQCGVGGRSAIRTATIIAITAHSAFDGRRQRIGGSLRCHLPPDTPHAPESRRHPPSAWPSASSRAPAGRRAVRPPSVDDPRRRPPSPPRITSSRKPATARLDTPFRGSLPCGREQPQSASALAISLRPRNTRCACAATLSSVSFFTTVVCSRSVSPPMSSSS